MDAFKDLESGSSSTICGTRGYYASVGASTKPPSVSCLVRTSESCKSSILKDGQQKKFAGCRSTLFEDFVYSDYIAGKFGSNLLGPRGTFGLIPMGLVPSAFKHPYEASYHLRVGLSNLFVGPKRNFFRNSFGHRTSKSNTTVVLAEAGVPFTSGGARPSDLRSRHPSLRPRPCHSSESASLRKSHDIWLPGGTFSGRRLVLVLGFVSSVPYFGQWWESRASRDSHQYSDLAYSLFLLTQMVRRQICELEHLARIEEIVRRCCAHSPNQTPAPNSV